MEHEIGTGTRDSITLGKPHPAEQGLDPNIVEEAIRRTGRRNRTTGLALCAGAPMFSLALSAGFEGQVLHDHAAQMFGMLTLFAVMLLGAILVSLGGFERLQQHHRAMIRRGVAEQFAQRAQLDAMKQDIQMISDQGALTSATVSRIERAVEKVPGYAEGLEAGAQLLGNLMDPRESR